ncbi:hypothetical protein [Thermoactinospora rubra]|uniref:hypothetical protein n=1 Tax=Thermoactinospora rubra TaxID=1088767 RepID=UPI000A1167ED|nr:hypothetical protein [Thermoactinospora rubra]
MRWAHAPSGRRTGASGRVGVLSWARRHGWFVALFAVAAALRATAMLGYRPALWFPDSYTYIVTVMRPRPDLVRPAGYSMFVKLLEPFHSFAVVAATQHLLGLGVGALVYWIAARSAPRWIAVLAAAPVLLDAYQIQLEHLLVSDVLFMALVVAATVLAMRAEPPAVAIGLLLAAASLTRTVGLPLVALVAAWLLLRRHRRKALAMLAAAVLPVVAYGAWFYATYHRVGIIGADGAFLYARTMAFADCARMRPPADLAVLCDARPPGRRPPSQDYVWSADSPLVKLPGITFTAANDGLARRFALLAIRSQPLDYAGATLSELARTFTWDRPVYPDAEVYAAYEFPDRAPPPPVRYPAQVGADFARQYERGDITTAVAEPYAGWLRAYQDLARLPGTLLLAVLLVPPALTVLTAVRRRYGRRAGAPATGGAWLLPWAVAWALLVIPPAVAQFDYRYVLPAVPLACLAAALSSQPASMLKDVHVFIPGDVRV